MLNHFKRSLYTAVVLLLLFQVASASGAHGTDHAEAHAGRRGRHRRNASPRTGHKPGAVVHRARSRSVAVATTVLLGDTAVEWQYDSLAAGEAEVFRLRADSSGLAGAVHVYISARSSAKTLIVGLYSSASDRPSTLLSTGSTSASEPGTWTTASIVPVELVLGRSYWLAILGNGGRLRYRDRASGPCPSETSAKRDLRALPTSWRTGRTYSDCPASAYVTPAPLPALADSPDLASGLTAVPALLEEPVGSPPAPPVATALPIISGNATEGQLLSASSGSWSGDPTSYAYQWQACDTAGDGCSNITGATSATHKLGSSDVGHTVRVVVTASNAGGSTSAFSEATATVVAQVTGPQVFVSQAGAGSESGDSCGDAHSLAWLKSEAHWGSGAGRVGAGTTVGLCGTLTEPVEVKGSGSAGKPVTLLFMAGAKIAMDGAGCPGSGCIHVDGNSEYVTIDGGTDGVIENTDRGTRKEKTETTTTGIEANGCKHCYIDNLEIANLYVAEKGDTVGNTEIRGITVRPEGGDVEYITIANDVFHDMGWAVNIEADPTTNHIYVEHDTFYHLTHGFTPGGDFNGGDVGPVVFAHNHFYGNLNWEDGETDTNHVDGVHCFGGNEKYQHYSGLYVYDNYITTEGHNTTAPIFLEGTNGHTPCGDKTSNIWVFNNVLTGTSCCGLLTDSSGEAHVYDNTLIGQTTGGEGCVGINSDTEEGRQLDVQDVRFKNNVVTTCGTLIDAQKQLIAANGMAYNLWANASASEAFKCRSESGSKAERGATFKFTEYSGWLTCMETAEEHSITASSASLNLKETVGELGKPESGSEAIGHGANLTSLCPETPEEALCKNIDEEARPSTGAWNIGAY